MVWTPFFSFERDEGAIHKYAHLVWLLYVNIQYCDVLSALV